MHACTLACARRRRHVSGPGSRLSVRRSHDQGTASQTAAPLTFSHGTILRQGDVVWNHGWEMVWNGWLVQCPRPLQAKLPSTIDNDTLSSARCCAPPRTCFQFPLRLPSRSMRRVILGSTFGNVAGLAIGSLSSARDGHGHHANISLPFLFITRHPPPRFSRASHPTTNRPTDWLRACRR